MFQLAWHNNEDGMSMQLFKAECADELIDEQPVEVEHASGGQRH